MRNTIKVQASAHSLIRLKYLISLLSNRVNRRALWISKPLWLSCFFFLLLQHALIVFQSLSLHRWVADSLSENTVLAWWTERVPGPGPNLISLLSHIGMIIAAEIKATWDGRPTVNMDVNRGKNPSVTEGRKFSKHGDSYWSNPLVTFWPWEPRH